MESLQKALRDLQRASGTARLRGERRAEHLILLAVAERRVTERAGSAARIGEHRGLLPRECWWAEGAFAESAAVHHVSGRAHEAEGTVLALCVADAGIGPVVTE